MKKVTSLFVIDNPTHLLHNRGKIAIILQIGMTSELLDCTDKIGEHLHLFTSFPLMVEPFLMCTSIPGPLFSKSFIAL